MFRKILIANRGEIAVRIIRTAREMGIKTVAVYSSSDKESMHVLLSDEAVCIGPAVPSKSYLSPIPIISAASLTGCEALHPGYGFLSENASFAENVAKCGIQFIGPQAEHIRLMGDKIRARQYAASLNIPVIPGTEGKIQSIAQAAEVASSIGYPVLIKAAGGGGGRGMRIIHREQDLPYLFEQTQKEVLSAFGNGDVYLEKYLLSPRHIEVQILGDGNGNVIHLGLRECSIQRRHQKIIEETQPVNLSKILYQKITASSLRLAEEMKYLGVGTLEFLVDSEAYYFIEMNTRIQVEHPITEMITRHDLIRDQIMTAYHRSLKEIDTYVTFDGHAIECRINAEHAETFMPSVGTINGLFLPGGPGVRVDTFLYDQYKVLPHYDSLLGKIICWDRTRFLCIEKMKRALKETIIRGISTNVDLHRKIMETSDFVNGTYDTQFIKKHFDQNSR
jgi:acetyl-CoA carboxylase biotin carboxylase subunit